MANSAFCGPIQPISWRHQARRCSRLRAPPLCCKRSVDESPTAEKGAGGTVDEPPTAEEGVDCQACVNTGFVQCETCSGSGTEKAGEYTVFCSICVGRGKLRCPTCGGKCFMCTI